MAIAVVWVQVPSSALKNSQNLNYKDLRVFLFLKERNAMGIEKRQQELFDKLRQADPSIIIDGVSDEEQYISAPYRIMYVLK